MDSLAVGKTLGNGHLDPESRRVLGLVHEECRARGIDPATGRPPEPEQAEARESGASPESPGEHDPGPDRRGDFSGIPPPLRDLATFFASYVVLPDATIAVISLWVMAARLMDRWDRFPHLAVSSPEMRCGK